MAIITIDRKKKRSKNVPLSMNINLYEDNDADTKQVKMLYDRINKMKPEDWEMDNLLQTAIKLAKMKRIRKIQTSIQMGLLVPLVVFMGYDAYAANVIPREELQVMGISMLVGLVVGGACGLRILFRMQRTNDDIIKQIEELPQSQE